MTKDQAIEFLYEKSIIDKKVCMIELDHTTIYQDNFDPEYSYKTFGEYAFSEDVIIDPQSLFNALLELKLNEEE